MKKLLIGLLVLGNISTYAADVCSRSDKTWSEIRCDNDILQKQMNIDLKIAQELNKSDLGELQLIKFMEEKAFVLRAIKHVNNKEQSEYYYNSQTYIFVRK